MTAIEPMADEVLDMIITPTAAEHYFYLEKHNPGLISYTATRWSYLLRRPKGWHKKERIPTAGMSYLFVLYNPHVNVCLMAPSNIRQLQENIAALREGPLSDDDMAFMRKFGDVVHHTKKWFM
jgi:aryl-alcohol dehydrogenase-like predicted oxidoreductase